MTADATVGWRHRLNGRECERTPGDGEGQGSLACFRPWGHKEWDMTQQLNKKAIDAYWASVVESLSG